MTVNPGRNPINEQEAVALINSFKKIFVPKGKRILTFQSIYDDKNEILKASLGRTGKLRSPAVQVGDTLYIGYNNKIYRTLIRDFNE